MQILTLPYPPSVNTYYRSILRQKGRVIISEKGRIFRNFVIKQCLIKKVKMYVKPIALIIFLYPPDKRKRDIDNICKPLIDALQKGGLFKDDCLVSRLQIIKGTLPLKNLAKILTYEME